MVAQQEFTYKYIFIFPSVKLLHAGMYHIYYYYLLIFHRLIQRITSCVGSAENAGVHWGNAGDHTVWKATR